jgi:hypothetical protein
VFSHRQQTTIDQYLAEYAEADGLGITMNRQFAQVLVIPAYSERPATLSRLWAEMPADVLIILVINAPAYDPKTIALLAHFETDCSLSAPHARWRASLQKHKAGLLVINRCHPGAYIPERQGVGLARKIGADIALKLINQGIVQSPIIHSTDADARLPKNYFTQTQPSDAAGWVYAYRHRLPAPEHLKTAMRLYELKLSHFTGGLNWARSRFGHASLGSIIAISAAAYAQVRGFPKRPTGEDFYLLNKLAKIGPIIRLQGARVVLSPRLSNRVPIGTGTGVRALIDCNLKKTALFYNPETFSHLKTLLATLTTAETTDLIEAIPNAKIQSYFASSNCLSTFRKLEANTRLPSHFQRALLDWFDGFQQLKFIHHLRDLDLPDVTLDQVLLAPWFRYPQALDMSHDRLQKVRDLT